MKRFPFTIIATGLDPEAEDFVDRFFNAGCDDATISFQKGVIVLEFEREARNFAHALVSAMRDVQRAGARVRHVEPDYLVSSADIARRAEVSRAAASLFAKGERGQDFPAPVARVTTENPLWDWVQVARWMFRRRTVSRSVLIEAKLVQEANVALQAPEGFEHTIFAKKLQEELAKESA